MQNTMHATSGPMQNDAAQARERMPSDVGSADWVEGFGGGEDGIVTSWS